MRCHSRCEQRNCLQRERLIEGDNPLAVQELLRVQNFGLESLQDLLFTMEDFLNECVRIGSTDSREASEPNARSSSIGCWTHRRRHSKRSATSALLFAKCAVFLRGCQRKIETTVRCGEYLLRRNSPAKRQTLSSPDSGHIAVRALQTPALCSCDQSTG